MWYSGTSQVSLIGFGGMDFIVLCDSLKAVVLIDVAIFIMMQSLTPVIS